jgi:hypothetical protein
MSMSSVRSALAATEMCNNVNMLDKHFLNINLLVDVVNR